ncbi:MAG: usg protein [Hyphomicrobiaceae bacterium]
MTESATTNGIDRGFIAQLKGFSLTTAEILYRLPDYPALLQTYIWQDYDEHPSFPKLRQFLDFWSVNLEGRLYRVRVAHQGLISPAEMTFVDGELRLH